MVKLMVIIRRRGDLTPEQFRRHWREVHGPLVRDNPATKRFVRRYVQCHTLTSEYGDGAEPYDGVAELWFDSLEDKQSFFSDPDYLRDVQPDEARFADMERTVFFVTQEEGVV